MPLGANKAAIMGVAGVSTGDVVLIQSQTADGDSTISFTSGIDSTYGEYIFKFYVMNPATDGSKFGFQVNAASQSGYNETITSTYFRAMHMENDSSAVLGYRTTTDQAQGTAFQDLTDSSGSDADECFAGELHLFNPASTTYVKHFTARTIDYTNQPAPMDTFVGGYINTTAAITEVQFKMASGNLDGTIKLWGVK